MDEYIRKQNAVEECGEWYVEEGTEEGFIGTVSQMLDMFSPADVVPVVRCKDCKFRENDDFCTGRGFPYQLVPDGGFCDKGERAEE